MAPKVGQVQQTQSTGQGNRKARVERIIVKQGQTLTSIAKEFGMSVAEFKTWTGLDKNTISIGQEIKLPTAKAKDGKGIYAIAREYGMTMAEFAKLNNIQNPNEYQAAKDEVFYIKPKAATNPPAKPEKPKRQTPARKPATPQPAQQPQRTPKPFKAEEATGAASGAVLGAVVGKVVENQKKWGSSYTPEELSSQIYELSEKYWGAVGKPDFDALIDQINPKNASAVIEAYTKNEKNKDKESLIFTILREVKSKPEARKAAALKVYDALAKEKGAPASKREEFVKEVDKQFDSWGLVSTKKLDSIINEIMTGKSQGNTKTSGSGNVTYTGVAPAKDFLWNPSAEYLNRTVNINGKTFTVKKLHDDAVASAKKDPAFSAVDADKRYTPRPYPYVNENGQIEAFSEVRQPTNPNGPLKGKVVIINSGHGGYSPANGCFDAGTVLSVKNAEGNEMPVEEWRTADMYAEEVTKKLQAKGATVVFVNGAVRSGGMGSTAYLENLLAGKKGSTDVQRLFKNTKKSDIAFMSIHVESVKEQPSKRACTVRAFPGDAGDDKLAKKINTLVGQHINILQPQVAYNNYYVTRAMGSQIPAVLVELGNIANKDVKASLLSSNDRGKYTDALALSIEETLLNR